MTFRLFLIALVTLLLLSIGCSRRFRLSDEQLALPSAWPFHRGSIQGLGSVESDSFSGRLNILWEKRIGDKPAGPLTISHGTLIYPGSRRKVRFFGQVGGDYLGHWRAKRSVQTGLVMLDSLAYYGTSLPYERLCCIDLIHRRRVWRQRVKDAAAGTIIIDDRLIVASSSGLLQAFDAYDGNLLWSLEVEGRLVAGPTCDAEKVYQPVDNGTLLAVAVEDGQELFRVELPEPLAASVAVDDMIYVSGVHGTVFALDSDDGHVVWQTSLGGDAWTAPTVLDGRLFVGLSSGELVALQSTTGEELWRFQTVEVVRASATAIGKFVVVGTMGGKLFCLDAATGTVADQRQMDGAIAVPPVSDGRRLFVATDEGEITCFGDEHEEISRLNQRIDSGCRPQRTGPFSGQGVGHGRSQGLNLRFRPSDGSQGAGETVPRLRMDLPL